MKIRLYIDGIPHDEIDFNAEVDIYETVAYWHIKYELKRRMRFEIFLILPSKINK